MRVTLEEGEFNPNIRSSFMETTIELLESIEYEINQVINSGDLDIDFLTNNNLIRYNTYCQQFQSIELYRFRVIEKYGDAEIYFNQKIERIYEEIGNLQIPPIITTISNSEEYYWAHPLFELIAVPMGEEKNLLNLPDLYHEIGHLIFKQYNVTLIGQILDSIKKFYATERQIALDEHKSGIFIDLLRKIENRWKNGWLEEFTCDIIATYLVQKAYAWTNMKITANSSANNAIYISSSSHPSDESRNKAILYALKKLGCPTEEVKRLEDAWKTFMDTVLNDKPDYYDYHFPDVIINELVDNIIQGCSDILLINYPDQIARSEQEPISKILNDAWDVVLDRPAEYSEWERNKITEIENGIGNTGVV